MTKQTKINLPPAYRLAAFESLDSTNAELTRLAKDGAEDGLIITAAEQNAGRGRRGRSWISQRGNLFCSILKRPHCSISKSAQLSFVAALAVHDAISQALDGFDCDVQCKWPNDVLIDGYKVSGILLESAVHPHTDQTDRLIIGIGVNLVHAPADTPYPCGYVNAYREELLTADGMLEKLLTAFDLWYNRWETLGFQAIRDKWMEVAKGIGQDITVNLSDQQLKGVFESLDPDGALVLRTAEGLQVITAGDVFFD